MKYLIYIAAIVLPFISTAKGNKPCFYGEVGGGGGNFAHIKFGLNALIAGEHTAGFACYVNFRDSRATPSDYSPGLKLFGDGYVQDVALYGVLTYGRMITITDILRFNLKGGLAAGGYQHPVNFIKDGGKYFGSSYTYTTLDELLVGAIINPSMELTITNGWGLTVGPQVCINNRQTVIGIEVNTIFGRLRQRRAANATM